MGSIRNKINVLEQYIAENPSLNVICLTEHWLRSEEMFLYVPKNFVLGSAFCRETITRGGSVVFVREGVAFSPVLMAADLSVESSCEMAAVELKEHSLIICSIYRPPDSDASRRQLFLDKLETFLSTCSRRSRGVPLVLAGDFNMHFEEDSHFSDSFLDVCRSFGLRLTIRQPTRYGACLDEVITNIRPELYCCRIARVMFSDHLAQECCILVPPSSAEVPGAPMGSSRALSPGNLAALCRWLNSCSWLGVYSRGAVNEEAGEFFRVLLAAADSYCPWRIRRSKGRRSRNFRSELECHKERLLNLVDRSRADPKDLSLRESVRLARRHYRAIVQSLVMDFNDRAILSAANPSRAAWNVIRMETGCGLLKPSPRGQSVVLSATGFSEHFGRSIRDLLDSIGSFCEREPLHALRIRFNEALLLLSRTHVFEEMVSWVRHRDIHLLTVGRYTYTSDQRFRAIHHAGTEDWSLQIKYPQHRDTGIYECQISTTPHMSHFIHLNVVEPTTEIIGGPDLYIDRGSTINLTCVVLFSPEPPAYIFWNHNDAIISYDSPRGGVSVITEKGETTTSFLLIQHARPSDTGRYQCNPSNAQSKSVNVHVLNDVTSEITSEMPVSETDETGINSTDNPDSSAVDTTTDDIIETTTDDDYDNMTYENSTIIVESTTDYDTSTTELDYETSTMESAIGGVRGLSSKNTGLLMLAMVIFVQFPAAMQHGGQAHHRSSHLYCLIFCVCLLLFSTHWGHSKLLKPCEKGTVILGRSLPRLCT
ncbi:hypothetical protein GE061_016125 [Apolygus lucorum]|uniref:Ig-like domain-containing protein n=1 Tax=Apolygus lucorum TaxID=248454 RepID=A0A8S9XHD8_APOLU|nr:hypothetical protein GE061_016125 [Apolygus lucorum]